MSQYRVHHPLIALAVAALGLLGLFEFTPLDLAVARLFWDPAAGTFSWRGDPTLEPILYHGAKAAMYGLGVVALVVLALAHRRTADVAARRCFLIAAATLIVVPLLVVLLKHLTNRYCPWALQPFGGDVPYTTLLEPLASNWQRGQCFPAGHAAGGFVWVGVALALWPVTPRMGRAALGLGLVAGGSMGLFRMAEGAHFLSHTLWTLWLACLVPLLLRAALRHSRSGKGSGEGAIPVEGESPAGPRPP